MTAQQPSLTTKAPLNGERLESLLHQMSRLNGRINRLYEAAGVPEPDPAELLPTAFKELGVASEELQVAIEELQQQNQELLRLQTQLSAERDRYREVFESAPDIYLITNLDGIIQEANRAAASFLNVAQRFLLGKPLVTFISPEHRLAFRQKLLQISQAGRSQECQLSIQPREADGFTVTATVSMVTSPRDELCCLQWLIRRLPDGVAPQTYLPQHSSSSSNLPIHKYMKGELIPCKLEALWQVKKGLVKLNTFAENGEEVFIGIAGPSLPFGPGLTSLQTYQATALTDEVELVSIAWQDIAAIPELAQSLLSQVSQRLQQAEQFLAVCGQRRVQDRLHHFLRLLKQEVGQPVSNGTRIQVRLTHEDLANACCTTRVTVTRILGKLQQQGKITLDPKHYIILHDDRF